jgi:hypothetical protein
MPVDAPTIPPSLVLAMDLSLLLPPYDTASSGLLYTFLYFYHISPIIKVLQYQQTQPYRSNISTTYSALLHVLAVCISHHQVGIGV